MLWAELALPDAIRAAKLAGFDAVECHWPFDIDPEDVRTALMETGLHMLSLNTRPGDLANGDFGLAALPYRQAEAKAAISEAITYASAIGASYVHVMSGNTSGEEAHQTFLENLRFAGMLAKPKGVGILIEAINTADAPTYFLRSTEQAKHIIEELNLPNLKLMFDCYHVGRSEKDVISRLKDLWPHIGHIQFASVPDRGTPDQGDVDYAKVFETLDTLGWQIPLGAEYKPIGPTEASLGWLGKFTSDQTL